MQGRDSLAGVQERDILAGVQERDILAGVQERDILTGVQLRLSKRYSGGCACVNVNMDGNNKVDLNVSTFGRYP